MGRTTARRQGLEGDRMTSGRNTPSRNEALVPFRDPPKGWHWTTLHDATKNEMAANWFAPILVQDDPKPVSVLENEAAGRKGIQQQEAD